MMRNCELQTDLCDKRLLSIKVPDKIVVHQSPCWNIKDGKVKGLYFL